MLKDITIGQFYPVDSVIHALDPRVKLFATFIYIISLFVFDSVAGFAIITVSLGVVIVLSRVPLSFMLRGLRSIVILLLFAATINLLLTPGIPIFTFGFIRVTKLGLKNAVLMTVRMIYLIVGTSIMTLTTTPNALTDALEKSLAPLNRIGVPVHEIAMMMSIALRFIPILIEETDKIMKAQMARGADFESGGPIRRLKAMVPLLVPLFVAAFRRASDLALAMEARCYHGGEGRTKMKPLRYHRGDLAAYALTVLYLIMVIAARRLL
ncbi:MAG: energy-coupling factor transporter transmembrane protein EcfT [Lachnospiraceae bacterium]|nr:energy-coupling factor transporter transmembrane protein EcfT [Lachnospiraceae bacterium]